MRVITGSARGRTLETVKGEHTRPTASHIKESIFNIIQFDIEGRRILDLFAGCGQMAIEALSRGAKEAVLVDNHASAAACIRKNLAHCELSASVIQTDALSYLATNPAPFDLIFLDPPYGERKLLEKALLRIQTANLLTRGGTIVCESEGEGLPELAHPCQKGREYRYGKKTITLYHHLGDAEA